MKLEWCPETAGKVYIDAIELLSSSSPSDSTSNAEVAELVAAMAGGWQAQCLVEAPWIQDVSGSTSRSENSSRSAFSTSLALAAAARHTGGRHVCVVKDEQTREEYLRGMLVAAGPSVVEAIEVATGDAAVLVARTQMVDFAVVDCRREDASRVLRALRPDHRGAVVVCKEAARMIGSTFEGKDWKEMFMPGARVVRAAMLPLGNNGVEVVHVGVGKGPSLWDKDQKRCRGRWIKHVDRITGEEHLFRQ